MTKFHVNPDTGVIGVCVATKRNCPIAASELHFTRENEAKEFGELLMASKYEETPPVKTNGKLFVFVGLPGSGKSTLAKKLAEEYPGALIANRDDMRTSLFGEKYHRGTPDKKSEAQVSAIMRNKMTKAFREGGVVIDDNTNTNPRFLYSLVQLARDYGASVQIIPVDVPLATAKLRNKKRAAEGGRFVPEDVIDRMASQAYSADGHIKDVLVGDKLIVFVDKMTAGMLLLNEYNAELEAKYPILGKDIALVDVDGTLSFNHEALDRNLGVVQPGEKKNWMKFYQDSEDSPVNQSVLALTRKLRAGGVTVFALTGRVDQHAGSTINFLRKADAPISRVIMGREGDFRGDYNVKTTALEALSAAGFTVVHSIDDRPSSIRVWEERGISVSRVAHHNIGAPLAVYTETIVDDITGQGFCVMCGNDLPEGEIIHDECRSE